MLNVSPCLLQGELIINEDLNVYEVTHGSVEVSPLTGLSVAAG